MAAPGGRVDDFEYLFSFYGLLLGLAAANVATGFADMWRERREVAVGISPPLLALIILLGAMNLWLRFWSVRESIEFGAWSLIIMTCVALPYVFLSRAMFQPAGATGSLEEHYLVHRRVILVMLALSPVFSLLNAAFVTRTLALDWSSIWVGLRVAAPLLLIPFGSRTVQRLGLAGIAGLLVVGLFR